jgi:hypothetical protein
MFLSLRLAAFTFFLLLISHVFGLAIPLVKRAELCNGHAELCDRSYGNTTYLGAHDSFAVSLNPFALARTQEIDVQNQLMMGVRLLQVQAHMKGPELHLCHGSCILFDGGSVKHYFKKVEHFLKRNPNEILTLIIANPENVKTDVWQPIFESTGLANMSYVPPQPVMSRDDWPTLKQMLEAGTRLVVFIDKGAEDGTLPYLLQQFNMMWEDQYDPTNSNFPCSVDRTAGSLTPDQQLNLINHDLTVNILPFGPGVKIPDRLDSPRTNGVNSITAHAAHCAPLAGDRLPNFVLVDFVNVGQGVTAVAQLNGFEY